MGKIFIILLMIGFSWFTSIGIYRTGEIYGLIMIVLLLGLITTLFVFLNIRSGFYIVLAYAFFVNFVKRLIYGLGLSEADIPLGIGVNLLLAAIFFGLIVQEVTRKKTDWSKFWTPITIAFFIDIGYTVLIAFNPSGPGFGNWFALGFRWISFDFMLIIVVYALFSSVRHVVYFTRFWLMLITITASYALIQKFVGLPIWDYKYLHSSPEIYKLNFIGGRFRLSGMLGDVSEAGLILAYSATVLTVFIFFLKGQKLRIQLTFLLVIVLLAMVYTGTRTAYAIFPLGLAFLGLINIKRRVTILAGLLGLLGMLFILFAPTSSPAIKRVRSTFFPKEDPSYQLREEKWGRIQPWIRARPIGSGLGASGPLDPEKEEADSGYVAEAIERGWIGLLIKLGFFFTVMSYGITAFYRSDKRLFKTLYLAYLCGFFIMSVAHLPQDALGKWPSYIIIQASFIAMIRLKQIETKNSTYNG